MKRTSSLLLIALLAALILFLEIYGLQSYFYWKYWWFDILMHGLGGFLIGTFALWIFTFEYQVSDILFYSLAVVLVIGVLWEVFEYTAGISLEQAHSSYLTDTMIDVGMDFLGGVSAYLVRTWAWESSQ